MKLITPMRFPMTGLTEYAVWEYDETKPRFPEAADMRLHYAVKKFVGNYRKLKDAEEAAD